MRFFHSYPHMQGVASATSWNQKTRNKMRSGLSLVELLLVVGIIGVLITLVSFAYINWRERENFRDTQRQIVQMINEARSESRRLSRSQTVSWSSSTSSSSITHGTTTLSLQDITLKNATGTGSGTIIFTAPFGRSNIGREIETITISDKDDRRAQLIIYGVTGKTQLRTCPQGKAQQC